MQAHAKQHFAHKDVTPYFGAATQILSLALQRATQAKAVQLAASLYNCALDRAALSRGAFALHCVSAIY